MIEKTSFIDTKHEGMIHDAQYDYYGRRLATSSSDGTIQIFDVSKGDLAKGDNVIKLSSFKAHNAPIWQIAWAHPKYGNILASCSFDRKVIIWKEVKLNEWQEVTHYEHQGSANAIAWAPWECGLKLLSCSADGEICLHSRKADDQWEKPISFKAHDQGVNCISWGPLYCGNDYFAEEYDTKYAPLPKIATGSCDRYVRIWEFKTDSNTFELLLTLPQSNDWVRDVAWCSSIGAPYETLVSCNEDGTVQWWRNSKNNEKDFKEIKKIQCEGPAWRLSWSFAGNLLAISSAGPNSENIVEVYKENEQGNWENISKIDDDTVAPDS